jgi:inorganic pyrophosphatase
MENDTAAPRGPRGDRRANLELEVIIEIPKGSFLKRGSTGRVDFVSPLPCPFNYGSVPRWIGGEGDLLDAVVLGPRLPRGTRVVVTPQAAIGLSERHLYDDKMICSHRPLTARERRMVHAFFVFYAWCKGLLNVFRARTGRTTCEGWQDVRDAMARARPRRSDWHGPSVPY